MNRQKYSGQGNLDLLPLDSQNSLPQVQEPLFVDSDMLYDFFKYSDEKGQAESFFIFEYIFSTGNKYCIKRRTTSLTFPLLHELRYLLTKI